MWELLRKHKKKIVLLVLASFVLLSSHTSLQKEQEKERRRFHTETQLHIYKMLEPIQPGEFFLGSSACKGCHGKDILHGTANVDARGNDVNLYDDWQATMMALSAKDPLWRAKVSHETTLNPGHTAFLENKCTSCHAPMGHFSAFFKGTGPYSMAMLDGDTLGLDGVSCMSCHMQGPDAGTTFSGEIRYDTTGKLYGPFPDPMIGPMQLYTGFIPTHGEHMSTSLACASCHTLVTDVVDLSGNPTGNKFIEQATYHEWKNSIYPLDNVNCQRCHMPRITDPVIIANNILALAPRTPFNLHKFMGGNAFMLQLMKGNKAALGITAEDANFDSSIANTRHLLGTATLDMNLRFDSWLSDTVAAFTLRLENKAGHKFPSGYPSRRAFVQFVATTAEGDTVFKSGMLDPDYELVGHDAVTEPHYQTISDQNQVQIYEMVMADVAGNRTTSLERANTILKDNRLPPEGFVSTGNGYDSVAVVGVTGDTDFNSDSGTEGSGADEVHYRVRVPGGRRLTSSINVYAKVFYQSVPPRWLTEMFGHNTVPINRFKSMYQAADKNPVLVGASQLLFILTPSGASIQEQTDWGKALLIGPNPTLDGFFRLSTQAGLQILSVRVYSPDGRKLEDFSKLNVTEWEYLLRGAAGQYVVRIETDKGTFVKKVIKQ